MKYVFASSDEYEIEGWIDENADLDGVVSLKEPASGETLKLNGWLFTFEDFDFTT